jgi:membrane associated rhomboid family serine protease
MRFFESIKNTLQQHGILTKLIAINVAVFLTINLIGNLSNLQLLPFFGLPVGGSAFVTKFWTFFTYMFTHSNLGHLFWNMLLFYFMSQVFFTILGEKKLLYLYVMSGLCGGALVLMMGLLYPASFANAILIGASAAVLGVGAVMAVYAPNYRVYLFGIVEMPYKYFYLLTFVLSTIIDLSVNTGGKISHIGGAAFGLIYGLSLKRGTDLSRFSFGFKKKSPLRVVSYKEDGETVTTSGNEEQKMNRLLDKISKGGYDSLSKKEKDELYRLSQKKS